MSAAARRRGARLAATALLALCGCASWQMQWPQWNPEPSATAEQAKRPALAATPAADLPAPERVRAETNVFRAIPLSWDPVLQSDVAGYAIERAADPDASFERVAVVWGRGESAYVDGAGATPLGDGVTAYYRVRSVSADGQQGIEASGVVVSITAPLPAPPRGLRTMSRQPREIPLAWRASSSDIASGYVVERSPSPDGPYAPVVTLAGRFATSYVDRGLGNLRVFYYRVATLNPAGDSGPPSEPVRGVTKPEPLPPYSLRVAESKLGLNTLVWEPNVESDIAEYRLYRIRKGAPPRLVASVPADVFTAQEQVSAGENATYAMQAINHDGLVSRLSDPVAVDSAGYGLAAETRNGGVTLRWSQDTDEFPEARIVRSGWLGQRELGPAKPGEYEDRDVEPGRSYRYVVVARRADGSEAPASRPLEVRVPEASEVR
jgi:fibronectin type 3 domain-containing protein